MGRFKTVCSSEGNSCGQVISVTSAGLVGKEGIGPGVLQGSRNCVIRYMGKKKLEVLKFQSHLLCSAKDFFFYVLKEFSPGFDVTFPV